jgi:hypothetical protein
MSINKLIYNYEDNNNNSKNYYFNKEFNEKKIYIYNNTVSEPLHKIWLKLENTKIISHTATLMTICLGDTEKNHKLINYVKFIGDLCYKFITSEFKQQKVGDLRLFNKILEQPNYYSTMDLKYTEETLIYDETDTEVDIKTALNKNISMFIELEYIYITNYNAAVLVWSVMQLKICPNINTKKSFFITAAPVLNVAPASGSHPAPIALTPAAPAFVLTHNPPNNSANDPANNKSVNRMGASFIPNIQDLTSILKALKPTNKTKDIPQKTELENALSSPQARLNKTITKEHISMVDILKNEFNASKKMDDDYDAIFECYEKCAHIINRISKKTKKILNLSL